MQPFSWHYLTNAADRIEDVTDNVRLGFGSFVDKVTRPYTWLPLLEFCDENRDDSCAVPRYAFRHQITLTDDIPFYNVTHII